jgi:hypothetical protein
MLQIVGELDDTMTDVIVAAWCARLWTGYQMEAGRKPGLEVYSSTLPSAVAFASMYA